MIPFAPRVPLAKFPRRLRASALTRRALRTTFKIAALLALASVPSLTKAVTLNFDPGTTPTSPSGGTGNWDLTTPDWSNGTTDQTWTDTTGTGDTATFAGTAGTATLNANLGALGLVFSTTGYTVGGTTNTLSLGVGGITGTALTSGTTTISSPLALVGSQAWNFGTGATLSTGAVNLSTFTLSVTGTGSTNITDVISGSGGLTKTTGAGTLTLSGANTFTGAINYNGAASVNEGNIRLANSAALGTGTKTINMTTSTGSAIGAIELIGGVSIPSGISFNLGGRSTGPTFSFLRNVSGNNTFAGGISIGNSGGGYSLESQAGTLTLTGGYRNNVTGGTRALVFYADGGNFVESGVISDNGTAVSALSLTSSSGLGGNLTVSGTNTYSGGTAIGNGGTTAATNFVTLLATNSSALGTGAITISGSGTAFAGLQLSGGITTPTTNTLTLSGGRNTNSAGPILENVSGNNKFQGAIFVAAGGGNGAQIQSDVGSTLTLSGTLGSYNNGQESYVFQGAGNTVVSGVITSAGGITQRSTGTTTLTGANNIVSVTVSAGVLSAAATTGQALGGATSVAVSGGATLSLGTANQIPTTASISLSASSSIGILSVAAGANQGTAAVVRGGVVTGTPATSTAGLGALTLNNTATITFNGAATMLVFGTFTDAGNNVLLVNGYNNATATANGLNSGGAGDDRLVFSGTLAPVADFAFDGNAAGVGVTEIALDSGFYEVAFTGVPEPGTWALGLLGLGAIGVTQRRRLGNWLGATRLG